jgi:hypothetical protein
MMMKSVLVVALVCVVGALAYETELQPPVDQMLLDEKAHKAAVKASYQSNVKTIYFHLEEIIKKILAHKTKWTNKYNGDLAQIAKGLLKHKNNVKDKMKKYLSAKDKKGAANKLAALKGKSWNKAKAKLKAKKADAAKEKAALKGLYVKGLKQKEGEICMIRKIQCMVAKFNGEAGLQKKYCGACKEKSPTTKITKESPKAPKIAAGGYIKKYSKKWPHCKNIKCTSGSRAAMQKACNGYNKCSGFSFSAGKQNGSGCLKACGGKEFNGFGFGSHDYWRKP